MINFKELEQELQATQDINFENKPPYGVYMITIANVQRRIEPDKNRERVSFTYRIFSGTYEGYGIRDSYYLSGNSSRNTQIFQYKNIKDVFKIIAPEITFNFENMEELEQAFPKYKMIFQQSLYQVEYKTDMNGYEKVYFQKKMGRDYAPSLENSPEDTQKEGDYNYGTSTEYEEWNV